MTACFTEAVRGGFRPFPFFMEEKMEAKVTPGDIVRLTQFKRSILFDKGVLEVPVKVTRSRRAVFVYLGMEHRDAPLTSDDARILLERIGFREMTPKERGFKTTTKRIAEGMASINKRFKEAVEKKTKKKSTKKKKKTRRT